MHNAQCNAWKFWRLGASTNGKSLESEDRERGVHVPSNEWMESMLDPRCIGGLVRLEG